jgi:formylglycine-generating enzyme required for sulfatase activity
MMQTQAYFNFPLQEAILQINKSHSSICLVLPWTGEKEFLEALASSAAQGASVEWIVVRNAANAEIRQQELQQWRESGIHFLEIGGNEVPENNGFCVFDQTHVLFGPLGIFSNAADGTAPLILANDAAELAETYIGKFNRLKQLSGQKEEDQPLPDFSKIIKRLELIKTFAALEEAEEIDGQLDKLRAQAIPAEVLAIMQELEQRQYTAALRMLDQYLQNMRTISVHQDGEVFGLHLEIRSLEIQLAALDNERIEAEKLVHEFMVRHARELGELILELLALKKENANSEQKRLEAEEDERNYREGFEANKQISIKHLNDEEKKQIKELYREAAMLCHPDRFSNETLERQKEAEEIFQELAIAYNNNDLQRVKEIAEMLKRGVLRLKGKEEMQLGKLNIRLNQLKLKVKDLLQQINELKETEVYRTASDNSDWDAYFAAAKISLIEQIRYINQAHGQRPNPINMVSVEGGTFIMGCTTGNCKDDEKPGHQVTLSSFYIGKYPITQAEWETVMGNNPARFKAERRPVERVSWNDIEHFLELLNAQTGGNYRLPTEAEWEYAARGGKYSQSFKYSGSDVLDRVAWFDQNSDNTSHEVGLKEPNELGLYDMSGNVWEWCSDWYGAYKGDSQIDPQGPEDGSERVLRGGSWYRDAQFCRVLTRAKQRPEVRIVNIGFRLVATSL